MKSNKIFLCFIILMMGVMMLSIAYAGVTQYDLTGMQTGGNAVHEHVWAATYDSSQHFEYCFICNSKRNVESHSSYLQTSGLNICNSNTAYVEYCTKCGYSHNLQRQQHYQSANPICVKGHNSHRYVCGRCGWHVYSGYEQCLNPQGKIYGCEVTGTCPLGTNYSVLSHGGINSIRNGYLVCSSCGKNILKAKHETIGLTGSTEKKRFTFSPLSGSTCKINSITVSSWSGIYANQSTTPGMGIGKNVTITKNGATYTMGDTITANDTIVVTYETNYYNPDWATGFSIAPSMSVDGVMADGVIFTNIFPVSNMSTRQDFEPPVIKNLRVEYSNYVSGYAKKARVYADITDNWDSLVYIRVLDSDQRTVLSDYKAVGISSGKAEFDIVAEVRGKGNVYIQAKDRHGNISSLKALEIKDLDNKPPEIDLEWTTGKTTAFTTGWKAYQDITFSIKDVGLGGVYIGFNSRNDYTLATEKVRGGKSYWTRTIRFYGNVNSVVTGALYAKDGLGNESMFKITFNLFDKTTPTIERVTPKYVPINTNESIQLKDGFGVLAGYYISQSSTVPSASAAGWTTISGNPTSKTITYKPTNTGWYYVYTKDAAGNVSAQSSFEAGVVPVVTRPADLAIKENTTAKFEVSTSSGTPSFTCQWYKNTTNSNVGGTKITGATGWSYSFTAKEADNNTYYYCEVTNRFGSAKSQPAKLIVYYPHKLNALPDVNLKKNETYTLQATISKQGNTQTYTYQWYKVSNLTSPGTRISGATSSSYVLAPKENVVEYYYCEVSNKAPNGNVLYTVATNRAKLTADVTEPIIDFKEVQPTTKKYMNKVAVVDVKFETNDTGQGYPEDGGNFTGSDVQILVNGVEQTGASRTMTLERRTGDRCYYNMRLTNVTGNGKLSFRIPQGSIRDNFGNLNVLTTFETDIIVDNIAPVISEDSLVSGPNDRYANKEKEIIVMLKISEAVGIEPSEFTADDIIVKVGNATANSDLSKRLEYVEKRDSDYYYKFTITNIKGDGTLSLNIPEGKIKDWALNNNVSTNFNLKLNNGTDIIIDNTPPVFSDIVAEFNNYGSGTKYPGNLASWHDEWANQDIFITLVATDENRIDYYMTSSNGGNSYDKMPSNQERLSNEFNANMYYRVFDMAGNYTQKTKLIKIDKTKPEITPIGIYELRDGGAEYIYKSDIPSNKTLYVKALATSDKGEIKSEIESSTTISSLNESDAAVFDRGEYLAIDGNYYVTYFIINRYTSIDKSELIYSWKAKINESAIALIEDGYYEVQSTTTDNAGNTIKSEIYPIYIKKRADNIITLRNILDVGSGVKTVTINVYKGTSNSGQKAIDTIVVDNPYKEYQTAVRLGKGTYYVEVVLEDYVGLTKEYHKVITNDF